MGNSASASQSQPPKGVVGVQEEQPQMPTSHNNLNASGSSLPPECPMHKKVTPPAASECPVGGGNDINPLNMVGVKI